MLGIDASFSRIDRFTFREFYKDGYRVFVQDLWLGGYGTPPANQEALKRVAASNLQDALDEGFIIKVYYNCSPWYDASISLLEAKAAASYMWPLITQLYLDVEIDGVSVDNVQNHLALLKVQPDIAKTGIYTRRNFWIDQLGNSVEFSNEPLWDANYNDKIGISPVDYGGWIKADAHQYRGTTNLYGVDVDLNFFDEVDMGSEVESRLVALEAAILALTNQQSALQEDSDGLHLALAKTGILDAANNDIDVLAAVRGNQRAILAIIKALQLPPDVVKDWLG